MADDKHKESRKQAPSKTISPRTMRKLHKQMKHVSRLAYRTNGDIARAEDLAKLKEREAAMTAAKDAGDIAAFEKAAEALDRQITIVKPRPKNAVLAEWVEILVVAIAVAMGFRAFFLQPYKIPTGSMQETLWGITYHDNQGKVPPVLLGSNPANFAYMLLTGEKPIVITAKRSGNAVPVYGPNHRTGGREVTGITVAGEFHSFNNKPMAVRVKLDQSSYVKKGDVLAFCNLVAGDHILVNRVAYNFRRPKRGDIAVFSTKGIADPRVNSNTFYIKRMVGMPGETVSIDEEGLLRADGEHVTDPPFFKDKTYLHTASGKLRTSSDSIRLEDTQYLMMGDNTGSSLDGRYFGAVERERYIGPHLLTYWPFVRNRDEDRVGKMLGFELDNSKYIND